MSMLKKQNRLTQAEFQRVWQNGKRTHTPMMSVIFESGTSFHGAVVVGKKVYKRAHDRNRLRRRLYAMLYQKRMELMGGTYIILTKPAASQVPITAVRTELLQALARFEK